MNTYFFVGPLFRYGLETDVNNMMKKKLKTVCFRKFAIQENYCFH